MPPGISIAGSSHPIPTRARSLPARHGSGAPRRTFRRHCFHGGAGPAHRLRDYTIAIAKFVIPGTRVRGRRPEHMLMCRASTSGLLEAGTSSAKARLAPLPGHDDIVRFLARNYRLSWSLVLAAVGAEIFCRRGNVPHSRTISELMVPMTSRSLFRTVAVGAVLMMPAPSAPAASCGTRSFDASLTDFTTYT